MVFSNVAWQNAVVMENDIAFLKVWNERWNDHEVIVQYMSKLFMYLDRFYTQNTNGTLPLREQGYALFKENVFQQFSKRVGLNLFSFHMEVCTRFLNLAKASLAISFSFVCV